MGEIVHPGAAISPLGGKAIAKPALPCYAEHREVKPMELQIEPRPGAVRVIVQGPEDSEEVRRILALL